MACLDGIAEEWDSCEEVRDRMREKRRLFVKEDGMDQPKPTVACAQLNFHVLKPLVLRLEESPGVVGMHGVPQLQQQSLAASFGSAFNFIAFTKQVLVVFGASMAPTPTVLVNPTGNHVALRIQNLYLKFKIPIFKTELKKDAKLAKGFMVLVKRKLQRLQICRSVLFRQLLALVFASTRAASQDLVRIRNMWGLLFPTHMAYYVTFHLQGHLWQATYLSKPAHRKTHTHTHSCPSTRVCLLIQAAS